MLDNHSAARLCCNRKKLLFLSVIFTFCAQAYASSELTPIEVPTDHTRDNVITRWQKPAYPTSALQQELTGEVTFEFDPDKYGGLTNVQIVDSKPTGVFDAAVLKTLNWWTVVPFHAAACYTQFPRTRITIKFGIKNGSPQISVSPPIPLADTALKPSRLVSDASDSESLKPADGSANKKTPRKLIWKVNPQPDYPIKNNRLYLLPGDVAARITIQPDGNVSGVQITFSAPHPAFGEEVEGAVKTWRAETVPSVLPNKTVTVCQNFRFRPKS